GGTRPQVELPLLSRRIRARLAGWHSRMPGDPFDEPDWVSFSEWLNGWLEPVLGDEGVLVVIELEGFAGGPFHVAARRWPCIYASSWTQLLRNARSGARVRPAALGIACVPRSGESAEVVEAMWASVRRAEQLARPPAFTVESIVGEHCDRAA